MSARTPVTKSSYDVLVIGSGAAGSMAAIHASARASTLLITDRALGRSNTAMAQGGLQVPRDDPRSRASMREDMLAAARIPVGSARLDCFIQEILPTVRTLERWGLQLDRTQDGDYLRRLAGGLSEARIVSVADGIGPALTRVLRSRLQLSPLDVCTHASVRALARVKGGWYVEFDGADGRQRVEACAVVCCTGGSSWYESRRQGLRTTNPENSNHELAAVLREELALPTVGPGSFQFQPYGIASVPATELGRCVPESISSFPVRLLDNERRELVSLRRDRLEITESIRMAVEQGRGVDAPSGGSGVWLTLSEIWGPALETAYPSLMRLLERHGLIGRDILVHPFLHYELGGFEAGSGGETIHPGLFLAGEMVGGLHGLNRLMGNGITDSLVHGRLAGLAAADYARRQPHR